ncbi:GNAT family N-acetyltransferase [Amycolatopsis sp. PS_44_ISF1]|uniref:GNAT family N-acetyltransferase n=1 Tax=Amycolatopsis sp. PS_44_ISF1 TaxID=2974917 RepID=UPI0028DEA0AE|nr:GNAT family N-acetyltransferase [Amycolatopsis sp. PS_44_ISF1]MDT8911632.1 GNAT family N-acetyltransferase [Amycolatopsis sp. PS_44_ISF1]
MIRLARPEDLPVLREVERRAGAVFRDLGMARVAEDEPLSVAELASFAEDGRCWVTEEDGAVLAYLIAEVVDGLGHIEQVSVRPDHARRGLGRELIETAGGWAARLGRPALTLTTYTGVPWNGPYYERLGFRVLEPAEQGPELRDIRAAEVARGLDEWPRAALIRNR